MRIAVLSKGENVLPNSMKSNQQFNNTVLIAALCTPVESKVYFFESFGYTL